MLHQSFERFAFKAEGSAPTLPGNVGIGTDSPGKELVVSKSGEVQFHLRINGKQQFHYQFFNRGAWWQH